MKSYQAFRICLVATLALAHAVNEAAHSAGFEPKIILNYALIYTFAVVLRDHIYADATTFFDFDHHGFHSEKEELIIFGNPIEDLAQESKERRLLMSLVDYGATRLKTYLAWILSIAVVVFMQTRFYGVTFLGLLTPVLILSGVYFAAFINQLLTPLFAAFAMALVAFTQSEKPSVIVLFVLFLICFGLALVCFREAVAERLNGLRKSSPFGVLNSVLAFVALAVGVYFVIDAVLPTELPFRAQPHVARPIQSPPSKFSTERLSREVAEQVVKWQKPSTVRAEGGGKPGSDSESSTSSNLSQRSSSDSHSGSNADPSGPSHSKLGSANDTGSNAPAAGQPEHQREQGVGATSPTSSDPNSSASSNAPLSSDPNLSASSNTPSSSDPNSPTSKSAASSTAASSTSAGRAEAPLNSGVTDTPGKPGSSQHSEGRDRDSDSRTAGHSGVKPGATGRYQGDATQSQAKAQPQGEAQGQAQGQAQALGSRRGEPSDAPSSEQAEEAAPKPPAANLKPKVAQGEEKKIEKEIEKEIEKVQHDLKVPFEILKALLLILGVGLALYALTRFFSSAKEAETDIKLQQLTARQRTKLKSILEQIRSRSLAPEEEVVETYNAVLTVFEMGHYPREEWRPAEDFSIQIAKTVPPLSTPFTAATNRFSRTLYGRKAVGTEELQAFREHVGKILSFFQLR